MKTRTLNKAQAAVYDEGGSTWGDLRARLWDRYQRQANTSSRTVEILHPEGFVIEAFQPEAR